MVRTWAHTVLISQHMSPQYIVTLSFHFLGLPKTPIKKEGLLSFHPVH